MPNRLDEVLSGREANYILPFVWQRGEDEQVIRDEIARVHDAGIGAVCLEARPHPDFLGPRWWRDMDIIMEEARARGMRVWVLDDDHFPTGHAAGQMVQAPAELRRVFLQEQHLDVLGPRRGASFLAKSFLAAAGDGARLVAVVAARREVESGRLLGEFVDLTPRVAGDAVYWDIPEGCWRVFFLISARPDRHDPHVDDINPLLPGSVRVLLDAVYEQFYAHYAADFGHTLAGFFSDEPGFYNDRQTYNYYSTLGRKGVALPWRNDLLELLAAESGLDYRPLLPLLWHDGGPVTAAARYTYMNVVTRLYGEHFAQQIGDWCRAHNVEYIGHVLEDNGSHTRLACGAGHFFRALWGQDMAGLDVVLWQTAPGFDNGVHADGCGEGDGEFFHYGLAKMASSLGHIDPKKHGRTMCELFGAYGWVEGLKLMKWLTDHMLVRGVNYFVPHAFSQAAYPDPDCPPHFYARGKNPQYRYYRELNRYTNRVSHLLSGGVHIAPVAVLYHAEAEWSGAWMPFHKPVKALCQHQIDCDVLPGDVLLASARIQDGVLRVADEAYRALVVPYSQALPAQLLARLIDLARQGLPVLFTERLPERVSDLKDVDLLARLSDCPGVRAVPLDGLAQYVRSQGWHELEAEGNPPYLRSIHIRHAEMDVYLFTNEHPNDTIRTRVTIRGAVGPAVGYDAFQNRVSALDPVELPEGHGVTLQLGPYESALVITGGAARALATVAESTRTVSPGACHALNLAGPWHISIATAEQYPRLAPWRDLAELVDLGRPGALPAFCGTLRYEAEFVWSGPGSTALLDLGEVYETAEVWLNGAAVGVRICPPYLFELRALQLGLNRLTIDVTNTLIREQQDVFSRFTTQEPSGLLGPVRILWE